MPFVNGFGFSASNFGIDSAAFCNDARRSAILRGGSRSARSSPAGGSRSARFRESFARFVMVGARRASRRSCRDRHGASHSLRVFRMSKNPPSPYGLWRRRQRISAIICTVLPKARQVMGHVRLRAGMPEACGGIPRFSGMFSCFLQLVRLRGSNFGIDSAHYAMTPGFGDPPWQISLRPISGIICTVCDGRGTAGLRRRPWGDRRGASHWVCASASWV